MGRSEATHARQIEVARDPLVPEGPDYADSFEIDTGESDARSAEAFARAALDDAPPLVYWTVWLAHRHVLRFDLGPRRSPAHVLGWTVTHNEPDAFRIEAAGPLIHGVIVGRRSGTHRTITTAVYFRQPVLAGLLMPVVAPVHRAIAARLLEYAAGAAATDAGRVGPASDPSPFEVSPSQG